MNIHPYNEMRVASMTLKKTNSLIKYKKQNTYLQ